MSTIRELHEKIVERERQNGRLGEKVMPQYQMDCLLHPEKYEKEKKQTPVCNMEALAGRTDITEVLKDLQDGEKKVYALIAPAFMGQFGEKTTPGRIRTALKTAGFTGMVEVAVFADILTLKEALEFDKHVVTAEDFQLTSCCCPVWIAMIRGVYGELVPHMPGAVSPMIAAGRAVKKLHPGAVTVFIGPCMAKKKEAKEPDIADAVDHVLTFQEIKELWDAAGIRPEQLSEDEKEHSSMAGRIYARTGGVSEAVQKTVRQLHPDRGIMVKPRQADGVKACKEMIEDIRAGKAEANFFEGMACPGGCVGGPKAVLPKEEGRALVNRYGEEAVYQTPLENPYVIELIEKLGFVTVDDFLEKSDLLTRDFGN